MSFWTDTEDWHTAGEPFRIVQTLPEGYLPTAPTVKDSRLIVINTPNHPLDQLRQSLCHEPRGHSDQYGGFITLPDNNDAHFGVLFWHKDGFSTACGHGTIALGYWAVTKKLVQVPENGNVDVVIDVPSGRVVAKMAVERGRPVHGDFINVKSYQIAKGLSVTVPSRNFDVKVNLAFAGAVYAHVDVTQLGLMVEPSRHIDFINSGTASRIAVLLAEGRLGIGKGKLLHRSIIDTLFEADIVSEEASPVKFPACIPRVRGTANLVGQMSFFIDPADPVYPGFLLR
ncbi:proline racemase [Fusarium langsethiae]|uniref:trans-L-3-hydroxyproline dehydratase n=1 Tax=Fusarium langsethiae TaxID=179993 RepID=A0A0N0DAE5_FUSLA|nr:proline racemase [Fusarium langsethiae]GKU09676.1 unnamed protein product [Fusarium langsethiae]GKU15579.1 unnamed protein product [Fusarium langsethiae]